ncbi:glycosyltransferase 87 family protein, partial [Aeropyrum camini]|uniref:glycosyltransferase 87 family protein n=1 Tax=Aeropyrum camini TaxID=229980 RepID=UPI0012E0E580
MAPLGQHPPPRSGRLESHYIIQALAATAMGLLSVEAVRRLAGVERALAAALLPSMAVYSVYNWDLLAAAPMLWGLYMFTRGRSLAAGILLGLGGAAKLLPLL